MKRFKKGTVKAGYRIVSLLGSWRGRMEYLAVPVDREDPFEYHLIVYDMNALPEECIGLDDQDGGRMVPLERHFLEKRPLGSFPLCVAWGDDEVLQWVVERLPAGIAVDEYVRMNGRLPAGKALKCIIDLCRDLETLSTFQPALGHFAITPQAVRICWDGQTPQLSLEGFGNVAMERSAQTFRRPIDEMSCYLAPELFIGSLSRNADVFGICLILYMLLTGNLYPWDRSLFPLEEVISGKYPSARFVIRMGRIWNSAPDLTDVQPEILQTVLYDGLSTNPNKRTESVTGLLEQLERAYAALGPEQAPAGKAVGFSAVAGLTELKEQMRRKFILPVRWRKLAEAYRITPPNGCLLYGPPGCGKTYVVERIAEEAGIPCLVYKPSDVASIYVHGGQEKIKDLFDEVRRQAPILVCFDEADAFVSNRNRPGNEHVAGEVNEFLTQLNNAAKDDVYVFLLTNNPELIDPAVLRTGRVDEKFYMPMPDKEGRAEFFRIRLQDIPTGGPLDYPVLADRTHGMTFSDLDYVVTESCRRVFCKAVESECNEVLPVTQSVLEDVISLTPRSVSFEELRRYEQIRDGFTGRGQGKERPRIGFV